MIKARKIELLAPAKNLECGIEAINHGADAVYIGAPKFSARSAAGNTIDDIKCLVEYAHQYSVKIYVALNTILKDEELAETEKLIWSLYRIGVDAIIIQDMGILKLDLPPIPLHASTQVDNRKIEKIKFLENVGFKQIVLARELSLNEIRDIAKEVNTPLEVFVHGALCVCYSGQCYLSESISQRSANRGACAQYCRLPYTLYDSNNNVVFNKKHLLSMKDLNLSDHLEELLEAGVSSLKIEGRLKDISYVKNVVAYYRNKLDEVLLKHPEYIRSSSGKSIYDFTPNLEKSFNRGFTKYFFEDRVKDIWSIDSPKSIGEPIGKVKAVFDHFFTLSGTKKLNNGDGLCFLDEKKELQGLRINRIDGENIYFAENNLRLKKGTFIYRNFDHEFDKVLNKKSAERKISTEITLRETSFGYAIDIEDEDKSVSLSFEHTKETAQKPQTDNIINNLSKTGNTIFQINKVNIEFTNNWFIPASLISNWRRLATDKLLLTRKLSHQQQISHLPKTNHSFPDKEITYLGNVMNEKSKLFYQEHQSIVVQSAFEKKALTNVPLMFTRHCIKYSMGYCPKENKVSMIYKEPFYLIYNETKLQLEFDCKKCEMRILKIS